MGQDEAGVTLHGGEICQRSDVEVRKVCACVNCSSINDFVDPLFWGSGTNSNVYTSSFRLLRCSMEKVSSAVWGRHTDTHRHY